MLPFAASLFPTVVIVRIATVASTRASSVRTFENWLRMADVQEMGASTRRAYGLDIAVRAAQVYLPEPNPNPPRDQPEKRLEQVVVPPSWDADPDAPAAGDVWVNTTNGTVNRARYDADLDAVTVETLATVAGLYGVPVAVDGPAEEDIGGGSVLVALGPAKDSARAGIQYRVDCTEQE